MFGVGTATFLGLDIGRIGDAEQRVMGDVHLGIEELDRVGGNDRQMACGGERQQGGFRAYGVSK